MFHFKSWTSGLRGKLIAAAIIPTLGFAILGGVSYRNLTHISEASVDAYEVMIPNIAAIGTASVDRANVGYYLWVALSSESLPERQQEAINLALKHLDSFSEQFSKYESRIIEPEEKEIFSGIKKNIDQFAPLTKSVIEEIQKNTPESKKIAFDQLNNGPWRQNALTIRAGIDQIKDSIQKDGVADDKQLKAEISEIMNITVFSALAAIFLTLGVLIWIAQRISNLVGSANEKIHTASSQVSTAIEQLTAAGQDLSHSSTSAAASLEETVASLEEISSMVQMNSDNAKQAATLSFSSKDSAEKGEREIRNLVEHMQEISKSSKKIEEIINVIDDIAFQTNLLALNAAVEAARAGEQGKGFAVVAEAVRALAQRSASAAKDITGLIKDSVEKIEKGTTVADRSGAMMNEILISVKKVSDLANEIAAASAEQTTGIQQVSKAMNQLDHSAQSNAASSEEIASTSEEISSQAQQMQRLIDELGEVIMGSKQTHSSSFESLQTLQPLKKIAPEPQVGANFKPSPSPAKTVSKVESLKPQKVATLQKPKIEETPKVTKPTQSNSSQIIPFDDDDGRGQVGDASGF